MQVAGEDVRVGVGHEGLHVPMVPLEAAEDTSDSYERAAEWRITAADGAGVDAVYEPG